MNFANGHDPEVAGLHGLADQRSIGETAIGAAAFFQSEGMQGLFLLDRPFHELLTDGQRALANGFQIGRAIGPVKKCQEAFGIGAVARLDGQGVSGDLHDLAVETQHLLAVDAPVIGHGDRQRPMGAEIKIRAAAAQD